MNVRHPVVLALVAALVLLLVGLYFVERQQAVAPNGTAETWKTNAGYVAQTGESPQNTLPSPVSTAASNPNTDTGPDTLVIPKGPQLAATTSTKTSPTKSDDSFDFKALLAQLAQLKRDKGTAPAAQNNSTYEQLLNAFSSVPSAIVTATKPPARSAQQQALFEYGNQIGAYIQGFTAVNINMGQTVTDQVTHRTDQAMGDAVRQLGDRYKALGESILAIHDVPPIAEHAHQALGQSYVNLGVALHGVPDATEDQAFLKAITTYNTQADAFSNAFVGMVTLFSSNSVTFNSADSGSVFTFHHN